MCKTENCKNCWYGTKPWSNKYQEKGYVGCLYCSSDMISDREIDDWNCEDYRACREFYNSIKDNDKLLGWGWVEATIGFVNDHPVFSGPIRCCMYKEDDEKEI